MVWMTTWKVIPSLSTSMTPPQNRPLPVFFKVPYYRLHWTHFIFLTCRVLCAPITPYICRHTTPSLSVLVSSCRLGTAVMTLLKYFTTWKSGINTHKTDTILFAKRLHPLLDPLQNHDTFVLWVWAVRCLGLVLGSQLLFTRHLHTTANKATADLCNIFPLLTTDPKLTQSSKLTLYKNHPFNPFLLMPLLSAALLVPPTTCSSQLSSPMSLSLQKLSQTHCYFPPAWHSSHSAHPSYHPQTYTKIFAHCPSNTNFLVQPIRNYTPVDLTSRYKKYEHKRSAFCCS